MPRASDLVRFRLPLLRADAADPPQLQDYSCANCSRPLTGPSAVPRGPDTARCGDPGVPVPPVRLLALGPARVTHPLSRLHGRMHRRRVGGEGQPGVPGDVRAQPSTGPTGRTEPDPRPR